MTDSTSSSPSPIIDSTVQREHHSVQVQKDSLVEGENILVCTLCNTPLTLLWDGTSFSLHERDAANPHFGTVGIEFV